MTTPFRRSVFCAMAVFALMSVSGAVLRADDPVTTGRRPPSVREVYIPTQEIARVLEESPRGIFVPLVEYRAMLERAWSSRRAGAIAPPLAASLLSARSTVDVPVAAGTEQDNQAADAPSLEGLPFTSTLEAVAYTGGGVFCTVTTKGSADFSEVWVDGEPGFCVVDDGSLKVYLATSGRHTVEVRGISAFDRSSPVVVVPGYSAPAHEIEVVNLPASIDVSTTLVEHSRSKNIRVYRALQPESASELRWSALTNVPTGDSVTLGRATEVYVFGESTVDYTAQFVVDRERGAPVSRVLVTLPSDVEVLTVESGFGPVRFETLGRSLIVECLDPSSKALLRVDGIIRRSDGDDSFSIDSAVIEDVRSGVNAVRIRAIRGLQLQIDSIENGIRRASVSDSSSTLYFDHRGEFSLRGSVRPSADITEAHADHRLVVTPKALRIQSAGAYRMRSGVREALTLRLPEGFQLVQWNAVRGREDEASRGLREVEVRVEDETLSFDLAEPLAEGETLWFVIVSEKSLDPATRVSDAPVTLELPRTDGVERIETRLGILLDETLVASRIGLDGWRFLDPESRVRFEVPAQTAGYELVATAMTLDADPVVELDVEAAPTFGEGRLTVTLAAAENLAGEAAAASGRVIELEGELELAIVGSPVSRIEFDVSGLPAAGDSPRFSTEDDRFEVVLTGRRLSIEFERPWSGTDVLRFRSPLIAQDGERFTIPAFESVAPYAIESFTVIGSRGSVDVDVEAGTGLSRIAQYEIPAYATAPDEIRASRTFRVRAGELGSIVTAGRTEVPLTGVLVEDLKITTQLDAAGNARHEMSGALATRGATSIELDIAPGAQVLGVEIDGEPRTTLRADEPGSAEGSATSIPLPARSIVRFKATIEAKAAASSVSSRFRWIGDAPGLQGATIGRTSWIVAAPDEFTMEVRGGTISRIDGFRNPSVERYRDAGVLGLWSHGHSVLLSGPPRAPRGSATSTLGESMIDDRVLLGADQTSKSTKSLSVGSDRSSSSVVPLHLLEGGVAVFAKSGGRASLDLLLADRQATSVVVRGLGIMALFLGLFLAALVSIGFAIRGSLVVSAMGIAHSALLGSVSFPWSGALAEGALGTVLVIGVLLLVRWIGQRTGLLTRWRSHRSWEAAGAVSLLLLLSAPSAHGEVEPIPSDVEILIPYDPSKGLDPNRLEAYVPLDFYELLKSDERTERVDPLVTSSVNSAMAVSIEPIGSIDAFRVTSEWMWTTFVDEAVLLLPNGVIESIELDGDTSSVRTVESRNALVAKKSGVHRVRLVMTLSADKDDDGGVLFTIRSPESAAHRFRLVEPEGWRYSDSFQNGPRVLDTDDGSRVLEFATGARTVLQGEFVRRVDRGTVEDRRTVSTFTRFDPLGLGVEFTTQVQVDTVGEPIDVLDFAVQGDVAITDLAGAPRWVHESGAGTLRILLGRPTTGTISVRFRGFLDTPDGVLGIGESTALPRFTVRSADSQRDFVQFSQIGDLETRVVEVDPRVAASELPFTPIDLRKGVISELPEPSVARTLEFARLAPTVRIRREETLFISGTELVLGCRFVFERSEFAPLEYRVDTPESWRIRDVVAGRRARVEIDPAASGVVTFDQYPDASTTIEVWLTRPRDESLVDFVVPRLRLSTRRSVQREPSFEMLTVWVDPSVESRFEVPVGWKSFEFESSRFHGGNSFQMSMWAEPSPRHELQLSVRGREPESSIEVSLRPAPIDMDVLSTTLGRLDGTVLVVRARVVMTPRRGEFSTAAFNLPASATEIEIDGADIAATRIEAVETPDGGARRVVVSWIHPSSRLRTIDIAYRSERSGPSTSQILRPVDCVAVDANGDGVRVLETRFVGVVRPWRGIELQLNARGLVEVDAESVDVMPSVESGLVEVYRVLDANGDLSRSAVDIAWSPIELAEDIQAVVELAELETTLEADGIARTKARYRVRNPALDRLRVSLPGGTTLHTVAVDGRLTPVAEANGLGTDALTSASRMIDVSIPRTSRDGLPVSVLIVYTQDLDIGDSDMGDSDMGDSDAFVGSADDIDLRAPEIGRDQSVRVVETAWTIRYPSDWVVEDRLESMRPVQELTLARRQLETLLQEFEALEEWSRRAETEREFGLIQKEQRKLDQALIDRVAEVRARGGEQAASDLVQRADSARRSITASGGLDPARAKDRDLAPRVSYQFEPGWTLPQSLQPYQRPVGERRTSFGPDLPEFPALERPQPGESTGRDRSSEVAPIDRPRVDLGVDLATPPDDHGRRVYQRIGGEAALRLQVRSSDRSEKAVAIGTSILIAALALARRRRRTANADGV